MVRKRRSEGQSRVSSCPSPTRCSTFDHHKAARYSTVRSSRSDTCERMPEKRGPPRGERAENQKPTRRSPTPRASTDRTNASFCQSWATSRVPRGAKTARAGRSVSSSNVVLVVTSVEAGGKAGRGARRVRIRQSPKRIRGIDPSSRGIDRRSGGGAPERGARRTGGSVHVRNTSRVTSPTPRGDQKQNWRVRSLISSPRERTSPGRRCGAALSRSGATTGGCRAGRGSGARSRARAFAAEKRTSRSTRGAAESRAAGVSTAARTVEGGEARPGKCSREAPPPSAGEDRRGVLVPRPLPAAKPRVSAEAPRKGLVSSSTLPLPRLASSRRAPRHVRTPDHALGRSRRRVRRGAGFERGAASRGLGRPGIPRLVVPVVG